MRATDGGQGDKTPDTAPGVEVLPQPIPTARWVMAAALVSLNLLDVITTKLILGAGGAEANPIMRPFIHDPAAPFLMKLSLAIGIGMLLLKAPRESRFADRAVLLAIGIYAVVIGWNTGLLLHAAQVTQVF